MKYALVFLFVGAAYAHADYFQLRQQIEAEKQARAEAEADAKAVRERQDHNARLAGVVQSFGDKHRGAYNQVSQPCARGCYQYRYDKEWIERITFDTGDGFECYASLWGDQPNIHCLHPQTREAIDISPNYKWSFEEPAKKTAPKRRRHH